MVIVLLIFNVLWNVNCWFNNDNVVVLLVKYKEYEFVYFVCVWEKNGGCKILVGNIINEWIVGFFFYIFYRILVNEIVVVL